MRGNMLKENFSLTGRCEIKAKTAGNLFYRSLILTILLCGLTPIAKAQIDPYTTETTKNTPDQTLRSNARVNPATLAMELSIPIANFPGRGGLTMPLVFNYSSKVWRF